jgi:hypothetical protein
MMKRLIVLLLLVSCAKKELEEQKKKDKEAAVAKDIEKIKTGCPVDYPATAKAIYAVGAQIDAQVDIASGPCKVDFTPDEKTLTATNGPAAMVEGEFKGTCNNVEYHYFAAKPARVVIKSKPMNHSGETATDKPVALDYTNHDQDKVMLVAQVVDKCGKALLGIAKSTWSNTGCEKIASLSNAMSDSVEVGPAGKGNCNISVEVLGLRGSVPVNVQ